MVTSRGSERLACQFQLIRYVPDAVQNEFVNIGVILREQVSQIADVRFMRDWHRVCSVDPDADIALLEAMKRDLIRYLQAEPGGDLMRVLQESLSLSVQMTAPKAYLAESFETGMEELMRLYVEPSLRKGAGQLSGRAAIHAKMQTAFEGAGVWDRLRKGITAAVYTRAGDSLRIDLAYQSNGIIRMFHAVSLEEDAEMAKVLAFSAAGLRAGVERVEKANLELSAVIEPETQLQATSEEPESLETYRFCVEAMEEHQIRVLTTSDLDQIAETARLELRI